MTTQTLSDISTLKPGTRMENDKGEFTIVKQQLITVIANSSSLPILIEQDSLDSMVRHGWKVVPESIEYDWKNELRERQNEFIMDRNWTVEKSHYLPGLNIKEMEKFIEEVIARNKA